MLLAAMLVDAPHAALEDRVVALDGVGVDDAANIFIDAVIDGLVLPKLFAERTVGLPFIGDDESFFGNVRPDNQEQLSRSGALDVEASGLSVASNKGS